MKKILALTLIMVLFHTGAGAGNTSFPRLTYGVEWSYIGVFYSGYHYNFFAPEGYRVDSREYGFMYDSNAEGYIHIGYNLSAQDNISLYTGLTAIMDYHHTIPVSIRYTRYYGKDHLSDRWFSFIDLGSGYSVKANPQFILTGKFGGGYRISLSRDTKLDILVSLRSTLTHPDIVYYDIPINHEKINRNNAYISALSLGMALTF